MKGKQKIIAFFILQAMSTFLLATPQGMEQALKLPRSHFVQSLNSTTYIDWTGGRIYSTAHLPELSNFENEEQARINLIHSVYEMPLYDNILVKERIEEDEELNQNLAYLSTRLEPRGKSSSENQSRYFLYSLSLYGKEGLYDALAGSENFNQYMPTIDTGANDNDLITSIVIEVKHLTHFKPALSPRIYSPQGLLIYGPEYVQKKCFIQRGLVTYKNNLSQALNDRASGPRPILFAPVRLKSYENGSDLVLTQKDSIKIMSSASARKALQNCKVTIVLSK